MTTALTHNAYFVVGTDTGVGKTVVSAALIHRWVTQGQRVAAMKPVASGAFWQQSAWHNDDVDILRAAANVDIPAALMNPYLLREPTAPHIAAASGKISIDLDHIAGCYRTIRSKADRVIVEGVGGFLVPLNAQSDTGDLACLLNLPVILVVGIRLGCLNHAALTVQAIAARGLHLAGWVANVISPEMLNLSDTISSVEVRIPAPMLGCIPHLHPPDPGRVAEFIAC